MSDKIWGQDDLLAVGLQNLAGRTLRHEPGLQHACQDDDQGGQHDEDGDEVDGDDPLALGRDAGEDDRRLPGVGVPAG